MGHLNSLVKGETLNFLFLVSISLPRCLVSWIKSISSSGVSKCVLSDAPEFFTRIKVKDTGENLCAPFNHNHILFFDFITNYWQLLVAWLHNIHHMCHSSACSQLYYSIRFWNVCDVRCLNICTNSWHLTDSKLPRIILFSIINYSLRMKINNKRRSLRWWAIKKNEFRQKIAYATAAAAALKLNHDVNVIWFDRVSLNVVPIRQTHQCPRPGR